MTTQQSSPSEIYGVAMEGGVARGSFLVFGLRDGSASMYFSSGGGTIGGEGRAPINAAARMLVEAARGSSTDITFVVRRQRNGQIEVSVDRPF